MREVANRENPVPPDAAGQDHPVVARVEREVAIGGAPGGVQVDVDAAVLSHSRYHPVVGGEARSEVDVRPRHPPQATAPADRVPGVRVRPVDDAGERQEFPRRQPLEEEFRVDDIEAVALVRPDAQNRLFRSRRRRFAGAFLARCRLLCARRRRRRRRSPLGGRRGRRRPGIAVQVPRPFGELEPLLVAGGDHLSDALEGRPPELRVVRCEDFADRNVSVGPDRQADVERGVPECPRQGTGQFLTGQHAGLLIVVVVVTSVVVLSVAVVGSFRGTIAGWWLVLFFRGRRCIVHGWCFHSIDGWSLRCFVA